MRSTVTAAVTAAFQSPQSHICTASQRIFRNIRRGNFTRLVASLHPRCHQGPNTTALNRYPEIFTAAAAAAPNAQRILSFGCSTGEECVTLASYFTSAQIIGTDINPVNLLKARKHRSEQIRFVYASDGALNEFGGFDAVFCMAVLRTWKRARIAELLPLRPLRGACAISGISRSARRSSRHSRRDVSLRRHCAPVHIRSYTRYRAPRHQGLLC